MRTLALCLLALPAFADPFPVSRCVNLDQALEAPVEGDWGYVIERAHIAWIAQQGFDTIRLPVRFSAHFDGRIDPDYLARVNEVIAWARGENLQIILDLHHFEALMQDPAKHAAAFRQIWQALGAHYAGSNDDLIFELLNEPSGNLDTAGAVALFEQILPDLRRSHPNRWIIIEGGDWANVTALADLPVFDDRTALSFHYYAPYPFTHQLAQWHADPLPKAIWGNTAERHALRDDFITATQRDVPLLLGEFGVTATTDLPQRINWTKAVRQEAEAHGIGWCHWGFAGNFAIHDLATQTWVPGLQKALFDKP